MRTDVPNIFQHFLNMLEACPERVIVTVCLRGKPEVGVAWSTLLAMAAESAEHCREKGVRVGDTVAIMRHLSPRMLADFMGVMLAGGLPCMVAPPNPRMAPDVFRHKLEGMAAGSGFHRFLIDPGHPALVEACRGVAGVTVMEGLGEADGVFVAEHLDHAKLLLEHRAAETVDSDALFLQHSSGTSGVPKGVVVTHRLLLNQLASYGGVLGVDSESDRITSWLPLYHDMGMVACLWGSLLWNVPSVHLSNFEWVLEPTSLLDVVAKHRATLVWMPNFSFAMLGKAETWVSPGPESLSSVRAWVSCSEPVLWPSMSAFLARYSAAGVRPESLHACYAMAENIFAVTQTSVGPPRLLTLDRNALEKQQKVLVVEPNGDEATQRVAVSCGHLVPGTEVAVIPLGTTMAIHPTPLPPASVGQILIRGTSLFHQYHGLDDLTAAAIIGGWYHTGDVGFIHEGEVFVTGRCRDLIICGGRNIDPLELETMASEIVGVVPGRVCCVGLPNTELGTEDVHLLVEVEVGDEHAAKSVAAPEVVKAVKRRAMELNFSVRQVWCYGRGWLVKSSSGKISRGMCRDKLMAGMSKEGGAFRAEAAAAQKPV